MTAINHLSCTGHVLDDFEVQGSISWLPNCCIQSVDTGMLVPYACWANADGQGELYAVALGWETHFGVRFGAEVNFEG